MSSFAFHDGNITNLIDSRSIDFLRDVKHSLQMHSSMVQRLSLERELEGHQGCVNTIAWNSKGSLLISGSDDTRINVWRYSDHKLVNCIDSGHSSNIFCTKFVPETCDELVASGAGDAEVRVFNISHLSGSRVEEAAVTPSAHFQCHTRRVKKLAVEVGNPNVIWSASEDGTLRQHDLREGCSCPPAGSSNQECRNVLLDLRGAAKRALSEPPTQPLHLKSCDISVTKPHLLLVGGSDSFARLYDRRMLPPLSSCQRKNSPPPCVNYFCPMHLSECGRSSLHLTHVAFSPNGEEVLINYSGEHIYLMDVYQGGVGSAVSYASGDVGKLWCASPNLNGVELSCLKASGSENISSAKSNVTVQLSKCRKLVEVAEKCLQDGADYYLGIEACNEVLDGGYNIDCKLKHDCLCTRAVLLLKRKWKNDAYMAVRDLYQARKIDSSSFKALYYASEALSELGKHTEALDFSLAAQCLAPSDEVTERVEAIRKQLSEAEAENNKKSNGGSKSESRAARVISLSDILYRSEGNSDNSQDGPRSDREDSDYDEELELDFETSVSGDEDHEADSNLLHGSLNLRIHRRPDSSREAGSLNGSCGSPSSSHQHDKTSYQPESVIDMKQRYVGHCNVVTDIKQASFLGQNGDYIAGGSDDGRWFIWEKKTGRLIKMLLGDEAVVNCIQCHPFDSVVATSGIDNTIKIWTPSAPVPSMVAGGSAGPDTANVLEAMEGNQCRLSRTREAILPLELLERFRMHDFTEGTLHPFECAQS